MVGRKRKKVVRGRNFVVILSVLLALGVSTGLALAALPGAQGRPLTAVAPPNMADVVPAEVRTGTATMVGQHASSDTLTVLFMMPFKDQAGLQAFIDDASDPQSANYGHYLTLDEENARFNPDVAHEQKIMAWLQGASISGLQTVPNHLYVLAETTTASLDKLLNVQINDYTLGNNSFYAPDRVPTLPASVSADITWVAGLSNQDKYQTNISKANGKFGTGAGAGSSSSPQAAPPYSPANYATAYDVNPLLTAGFNGTGVNIAITLWEIPPGDTTLNYWSSHESNPVATRANGRLTVTKTDGNADGYADDGEAGMDIESSSGMATHSHVTFYEAKQPYDSNLANALNLAGTAGGTSTPNRFITNSWGGQESTAGHNALDGVLQANTATGHDYLFSSGDDGSWSDGSDPYPDYPTASAYVTSIGGTRFTANIGSGWPGERTWDYDPTGNQGNPEGSGGGFSHIAARPSWQNAPGFPSSQTHRGYPDISAVGDPETGMYVCIDQNGTACGQIGGTSLSSPLWAGMMAITDQYAVAQGKPHLGFPNTALYTLARTAQPHAPYHDVTVGTNGAYNAGAGWDAVSGLGTPDLYNFARDLAPVTPPPCAGHQFTDVCPGTYYYTAVTNLVNAHIISGYTTAPPCPNSSWDPCFLPGNTATRGQVAKIITLGANLTINTSGGPHFHDVPTSNAFYQYIETMYHDNIIGGYTTGCGSGGSPCFKPGNNVTRGQLSKMAALAFGFNEAVSGQTFQDVPSSNAFYPYIQRLNGRGIIGGYPCGTPPAGACHAGNKPYFLPNNNITRSQLAKIVDLCRQQP